MWHRTQLILAIAELLYIVAGVALLLATIIALVRKPWFPLAEIRFTHALVEVSKEEVEVSLEKNIEGNFFIADIDKIRDSLGEIPWVRSVEIRRKWRGSLEIVLEEHQAIAHWGKEEGNLLINSYGEIFSADSWENPRLTHLPTMEAQNERSVEVLELYHEASKILSGINQKIERIRLSPRLAVHLQLDNGLEIQLGRKQQKEVSMEALKRFVRTYPSVHTAHARKAALVDLRYPNGFALSFNKNSAGRLTEHE